MIDQPNRPCPVCGARATTARALRGCSACKTVSNMLYVIPRQNEWMIDDSMHFTKAEGHQHAILCPDCHRRHGKDHIRRFLQARLST